MIHYGLACLFVCVLSLADRRAIPFALTIFAGWIVGYIGGLVTPDAWRMWPLISAVSGIILTQFYILDRNWRWKAVASLAGAMLLLDLLYLGFRWQRIPIEVEYSRALDIALVVQLLLVGYRGGINVGIGLLSWLRRGMGRGSLVGHTAHRKAQGSE